MAAGAALERGLTSTSRLATDARDTSLTSGGAGEAGVGPHGHGDLALYKFVVPAVAGPARLVPLPALATDLLSANALRVAATRGRLKAAKAADGSWRSSRAWVDEYVASRYRRS